MKVEAIDVKIVDSHRANWIFCRVRTEDGVEGFGEASLEFQEPAVAASIEAMSERLIGREITSMRGLAHELDRETYWRYGPVERSARSGIELALWDVLGKQAGRPVYDLIGGAVHQELPIYANGWFTGASTPDEFATHARAAVEAGFQRLKWDPFGRAHRSLTQAAFNQSMAVVRSVRDAVGPDVDLLIEGHGRFDLHGALKVGRGLQEFGVTWFEEPLEPGSSEQLARLRARLDVPVAAGERSYSRFDVLSHLMCDSIDVVQADICHVGGLLEMLRIAALADSFQVAMSPHNPNGPIAHAATLQLAATCEGLIAVETLMMDVPWRGDIANETYDFNDGSIALPQGAGWGVDIDWDEADKHPYSPGRLLHYSGELTNIQPPESRRWF